MTAAFLEFVDCSLNPSLTVQNDFLSYLLIVLVPRFDDAGDAS